MKIVTLNNGARLLFSGRTDTQAVAVSVFVNTGSVNETEKLNGISHFLEHMAFKGTPTRDYTKISSDVERLGANINAYTSQQSTAYYVTGLAKHTGIFVDLLADILLNSTFPEDQIEQERSVIIQEYEQYEDDPSWVMFYGLASKINKANGWKNTPLGPKKNINSFVKGDFQKYMKDFYTAPNIIIGIAGNVDEDEAIKMVETAFRDLPQGTFTPRIASVYEPGEFLKTKKTQKQTKLITVFGGTQDTHHRDHYIEQIAFSVMGGGMSSPLFNEVREKRGLAYSVGSSHYSGHNLLVINCATTEEHLDEYFKATADVMKGMVDKVADIDLERAQNSIAVASTRIQESRFSFLEQNVSDLFNYNRPTDFDAEIEKYMSITAQEVKDCFARIITTPPSIAMVGKCGTKDYLQKFTEALK
jgi:predicted Zn-dependent peptidase